MNDELELFDCDLCTQTIKFYPEGKCPWIKYKNCKTRLKHFFSVDI